MVAQLGWKPISPVERGSAASRPLGQVGRRDASNTHQLFGPRYSEIMSDNISVVTEDGVSKGFDRVKSNQGLLWAARVAHFSLVGEQILDHLADVTSVEHPEAPPCDLDGLEGVAPLLRFSAAGKALPRYLFDCICLPYSSN
eukprot:COSAG02_NODE_22014_length_766_cov_19.926537_1_plen_142_part_00